jgi:FMN reductase
MRILAIVGSPKADGRTTAVANAVLEGVRDQGADGDLVELAAAEFETVAQRLDDADGAVFAAPTYRARAAHPLKTFLDHLPRGFWGERSAPLQGKACAVALTGASWHHFLAVDELRSVLAGFFAAQVLSPGLYLPSDAFADGRRLRTESASLAALHGAALVDLARAVRESKNLSALRPLA